MDSDPTLVRWPGHPSTTDPWDDGCWPSLDVEGRHARLWDAWDAWRTGALDLAGFERAAAQAGVDAPVLPDRNKPLWGRPVPGLATLARIALDHWPAVGEDGPDVVLGPGSLFAPRAVRLAAVAGCAFVRTEDWPHHAFHIWARGKPTPRVALRLAIHAVELAPWALWEVVGRHADGRFDLRDATGLEPAYVPDAPVAVLGDIEVDGALAARVLRGQDGWVAHTAIPLESLPPRDVVAQWIRHEVWLARTHQPGITRESVLRKRPVLVRRAIEHHAIGQSPPLARGAGSVTSP